MSRSFHVTQTIKAVAHEAGAISTLLAGLVLVCSGCQSAVAPRTNPFDQAQARQLSSVQPVGYSESGTKAKSGERHAVLPTQATQPGDDLPPKALNDASPPSTSVLSSPAAPSDALPMPNSAASSGAASDGAANRPNLNRRAVVRNRSPQAGTIPANPTGLENPSLYPQRYRLGAPREKEMISLPTYVVAPPDVLLIDAVKVVPKSPYHIEPLDQLDIRVLGTLPEQPITGTYVVEPAGTINLGGPYGRIAVLGLTLEEMTDRIDQHLRRLIREPEVSVSLLASAGQQQISGEHLVGPDGTVNLGTYGSVYVAGLTLEQTRAVIENQLSKFLEKPKVSVDVYAYNSQVYYVIAAGAGSGDIVSRFPVTGNDTVLDALAQVNGLNRAASKKIWVARPGPGALGCDQVLEVNWRDIVKGGSTATNYQLLPGDRLFIEEDHWLAADSFITKITAPFERVFGFTLLGSQTVQNLQTFPGGPNANGR